MYLKSDSSMISTDFLIVSASSFGTKDSKLSKSMSINLQQTNSFPVFRKKKGDADSETDNHPVGIEKYKHDYNAIVLQVVYKLSGPVTQERKESEESCRHESVAFPLCAVVFV